VAPGILVSASLCAQRHERERPFEDNEDCLDITGLVQMRKEEEF